MTKDGGLRAIFRNHLPKFHWQSIESPLTGKGTPDLNYCFDGCEGWLELKQSNSFRRVKSIKPEQVAWGERRARVGGRVFMAVRVKYGNFDQLWIVRASALRHVFLKGLMDLPPGTYVAMEGGPRSWDWATIALILTSLAPGSKNRVISP